RLVIARHPHTVAARRKRYLASGLYPNLLEFKHEGGIALHLFADSADDDLGRLLRGDARHGGDLLLPGRLRLRHAELGEPRDGVAVRAVARGVEEIDEAPLHLLGHDVLPAARL